MEPPILMHRHSFHSQHSASSRRHPMDIFRRFSSKRSSNSRPTVGPDRDPYQPPLYQSNQERFGFNPANPFAIGGSLHRPPPMGNQEPPPSYSASTVPFSAADLASPMQVADDTPYAFLREFDTLFLIDDSGSMAGRSWRETSAALAAIAPICTSHDDDGIDIYFLNHRNPHSTHGGYTNITSAAEVQHLFQTVRPLGATPTGTRLNNILRPYLQEVDNSMERQAHGHDATVKPLNIIVITDGAATDDVESVIVSAARRLDSYNAEPWQVGIQFFQVGRDASATANLKELDDALSTTYNIRDMVDTVPWSGVEGYELTAEGLLKICLGSVVRRLDRRALSE